MAHGEWARWCKDELGMTRQQADRFIVVFEEFGTNDTTSCQLGLSRLYEIATLPPEERDVPHELPSGETKKPEEMTVRELRELKRRLRQAEQQAEVERKDFLRQKESNMRQIVGKAYTELGKELYEAQQRLASHNKYEGIFEKWYTALGWKKQTVYNLINRYDLVQKLDNMDDKERIEELPATLSYEIAKPNAESTPEKAQAKSEVLAGDIATLKEYRERIKELERKAEQAEQEAE